MKNRNTSVAFIAWGMLAFLLLIIMSPLGDILPVCVALVVIPVYPIIVGKKLSKISAVLLLICSIALLCMGVYEKMERKERFQLMSDRWEKQLETSKQSVKNTDSEP